jgi:caffeoyl-CoA O-methyltransferase
MAKGISFTPELGDYLTAHSSAQRPELVELVEETRRRFGDAAIMSIAAEQGAFMAMLVRLVGARRVVEVGTFTGYSSICLADALGPDGRLTCCDVSEEYTAVAVEFWERLGFADRVDLRLGPALDTLAAFPEGDTFDMAFIDADKTGYHAYFEAILARLRPGGLIVVDNVLWSGAVLDETVDDPDTVALRAFNDAVAADDRVDVSMVNVGDGLSLIRKR